MIYRGIINLVLRSNFQFQFLQFLYYELLVLQQNSQSNHSEFLEKGTDRYPPIPLQYQEIKYLNNNLRTWPRSPTFAGGIVIGISVQTLVSVSTCLWQQFQFEHPLTWSFWTTKTGTRRIRMIIPQSSTMNSFHWLSPQFVSSIGSQTNRQWDIKET